MSKNIHAKNTLKTILACSGAKTSCTLIKEEINQKYCKINYIYHDTIITIMVCIPELGGWEPQWVVGNLKVPHLFVTRLRGYAYVIV